LASVPEPLDIWASLLPPEWRVGHQSVTNLDQVHVMVQHLSLRHFRLLLVGKGSAWEEVRHEGITETTKMMRSVRERFLGFSKNLRMVSNAI
jgi:hypothetical protein